MRSSTGSDHTEKQERSIAEIQELLARGEAVVMSARELCDAVRKGESVSFDDVHVVTAATCGIMSGTYAVLSFTFTLPNVFKRARRVWLNGVEAYPGPAPNERLGVLDLVVHGTRRSLFDPEYGGGHLFHDLVAGRQVHVLVQTDEWDKLEGNISLERMQYAVLHGSRNAFRNYVGLVNPGDEPVETIFCSKPLPPRLAGATASGCGEMNPIQKDPGLRSIGIGTRVLMNGAEGFVTGTGTRSSEQRKNLSGFADMMNMDSEQLGGFLTSAGPEVRQTWAVPIPILDPEMLAAAKVTDSEIPLTMTDVNGRAPLAGGTYADLWQGTSGVLSFDREACDARRPECRDCPPAELCPTGAFASYLDGIDTASCVHCGICAATCHGSCFSGELGSVDINGTKVPFIQRLSDRFGAERAARELKERLLDGSFKLTLPVERIG